MNGLDEPTNLHVHGLHVSPQASSDNVFVEVMPGESFDYSYRLPADHPPGVYWYHPHHHGLVAGQIFAGLFGAIIVEEPEAIPVNSERVLIVSDTTLDSAGNIAAVSPMERMAGREGELLLLNGQSHPLLTARPGERERWRIINACVARYLRLRLDGQQLQLLGMDSGRSADARTRGRTPARAGQPGGPAGDRRRRRISPADPPLQPRRHAGNDGAAADPGQRVCRPGDLSGRAANPEPRPAPSPPGLPRKTCAPQPWPRAGS